MQTHISYICLENSFFQISTFFDTFSETKTFSQNIHISTQGIACLFGRLRRHEARQQTRLEIGFSIVSEVVFSSSVLVFGSWWIKPWHLRQLPLKRPEPLTITPGKADRRVGLEPLKGIAILWYWLVVWNINFIFPYIGNLIIPIDELIFFRGVFPLAHQPDYIIWRSWLMIFSWCYVSPYLSGESWVNPEDSMIPRHLLLDSAEFSGSSIGHGPTWMNTSWAKDLYQILPALRFTWAQKFSPSQLCRKNSSRCLALRRPFSGHQDKQAGQNGWNDIQGSRRWPTPHAVSLGSRCKPCRDSHSLRF